MSQYLFFEPIEASLEVCALNCGAKCCRAPGHAAVSSDEAGPLRKRAKQLHVTLRLEVFRHIAGKYAIDFGKHGGQCPFLGEDYACRAYDIRPESCRTFPDLPTMGCLVWPGNDPAARVEVALTPHPSASRPNVEDLGD